MKKGDDIAVTFPGLFVVHHNKPDGHVDHHQHSEHHLILPLQGEASVILPDDVTLQCSPGRMIYVSPGTRHAFVSGKEKGERLICMIERKLWQRAGGGDYQSQVLPQQQLIREVLFYLLLHEQSKATAALTEALVHTLQETLESGSGAMLGGLAHVEGKSQNESLIKAMRYLREQYAEIVPMAHVAKIAGVSTRSLNRLFLEELALTPKQYQTAVRMEAAQAMLLDGKTTVTEVGFAVGYSSLSQFIATFRQVTGVIPSEYARSQ